MQFAQIRDRVDAEPKSAGVGNHSTLAGVWVNSNPETTGITRMVITQSSSRFSLQVYAIGPAGPESLIDWGSVDIEVYTATPASHVAAGFTCLYDFGFVETRLQAMILKGLIVLAQIHKFKGGDNRVDYFVREYFALEHGRY